jgi:hypothetical protein
MVVSWKTAMWFAGSVIFALLTILFPLLDFIG